MTRLLLQLLAAEPLMVCKQFCLASFCGSMQLDMGQETASGAPMHCAAVVTTAALRESQFWGVCCRGHNTS